MVHSNNTRCLLDCMDNIKDMFDTLKGDYDKNKIFLLLIIKYAIMKKPLKNDYVFLKYSDVNAPLSYERYIYIYIYILKIRFLY